MTRMVRSEDDRAWRFVLTFALLLFCWSHRHALQLNGFADDLGLLAELPQGALQGGLVTDVFAKWIGPLWPGSTMWRPLPYSSFALDAHMWGRTPGLWRVTNLLLHLGVASLTASIAIRLVGSRLAGGAAFGVVLLSPWAPEVTLWLVGRFDGWSTLFIVVSLWAALKSRGTDRWFALSILAAIAAYMSKESALILPVWIAFVLILRSASGRPREYRHATNIGMAMVRTHGLLIGCHVVVAGAYLVWRSHLFSGQAITVYASTPEYRVLPLMSRVLSHLAFPAGLAQLAPVTAWMVAAISALYLVFALRNGNRSAALVGGAMAVSVVVAVAIHFANPAGAGEGYRLYYLATVGLALVVAAGIKTSRKLPLVLLLVFLSALAVWQSRVAAEWTRASDAIDGASRAMTSAATTLAPDQFGLVLMPDLMGHVPVARNAQGALLTLKDGTSPARDFFIIFTPPQLAEWHRLTQEDVVHKLTQRATAPPRITRYFCFNSSNRSLENLGYWPPATLSEWTAHWREIVRTRCPDFAF